jgi:hypothetical protein
VIDQLAAIEAQRDEALKLAESLLTMCGQGQKNFEVMRDAFKSISQSFDTAMRVIADYEKRDLERAKGTRVA